MPAVAPVTRQVFPTIVFVSLIGLPPAWEPRGTTRVRHGTFWPRDDSRRAGTRRPSRARRAGPGGGTGLAGEGQDLAFGELLGRHEGPVGTEGRDLAFADQVELAGRLVRQPGLDVDAAVAEHRP